MDPAIIDTHLHLIYRERLRYPWLADVAALVLGVLLYPLFALMNSGLDVLLSGLVAGSVAYGIQRVRARL